MTIEHKQKPKKVSRRHLYWDTDANPQGHTLTPLFSFSALVTHVFLVMYTVCKDIDGEQQLHLVASQQQAFMSPLNNADHLWDSVWGSHSPTTLPLLWPDTAHTSQAHSLQTHPEYPAYPGAFALPNTPKKKTVGNKQEENMLGCNICICIPIKRIV